MNERRTTSIVIFDNGGIKASHISSHCTRVQSCDSLKNFKKLFARILCMWVHF